MSFFIVDRKRVERAFVAYTDRYNAADEKIRLKIEHTIKVAELCETIAESLLTSKAEIDLAWLIGMLHDIGRFEQIRQYGTFEDAKSVRHAELAVQILFEQELISEFVDIDPEQEEYQIIYKAIFYHSDYRLADDLDHRMLMFCNIIRDADKLDILRVVLESDIEVIYGVSKSELMNEKIAEEVMACFDERRAVLRSLRRHPVDNIVGYASFVYELVYAESRRLCNEQGYIWEILSFQSNLLEVNEKLNYMKIRLEDFLKE